MKDYNRLFACLTLVCVWLFYLYEYMLRVAPSSMTNDLMIALNMNATQLSWMLSLYYLAYVALQIPCGVIVDAWGPRRVMTFSCLLCVVGASLFTQNETPWLVYMGRFLMGMGSACAFLSCGKVATQWFKPKHFPLIMGTSMMMGLIGATLGSYVAAILSNDMGWQNTLWIAAAIGTIVASITWVGIKEPATDRTTEPLSLQKLKNELTTIIKTPNTWWLGLYGCCMYLPLSSFAELWSTPYFIAKYNITRDYAAIPAVFFFWGGGLGCILSARLAAWVGQHKPIMLAAPIISCIIFALEFYGPTFPLYFICFLFGLNGMLYGVHMMCFSLIKETVSTQAAGTAIGFMNFCVMSSGLIGATLMGYVLDCVWDGQTLNDIPLYQVSHYTLACSSILSVAFLLATISAKRIQEPTTMK